MTLQCNPLTPHFSKIKVPVDGFLCTTNTDVHVLYNSTHRNTAAVHEKILISVKCPHGWLKTTAMQGTADSGKAVLECSTPHTPLFSTVHYPHSGLKVTDEYQPLRSILSPKYLIHITATNSYKPLLMATCHMSKCICAGKINMWWRNIWNIQSVPEGMCQTSGGCSLS